MKKYGAAELFDIFKKRATMCVDNVQVCELEDEFAALTRLNVWFYRAELFEEEMTRTNIVNGLAYYGGQKTVGRYSRLDLLYADYPTLPPCQIVPPLEFDECDDIVCIGNAEGRCLVVTKVHITCMAHEDALAMDDRIGEPSRIVWIPMQV